MKLLAAAVVLLVLLPTIGADAKTKSKKPLERIDRMWVVGAPALDGKPAPGVYVWVEDGRFRFAVPPGRSSKPRFYQWTLRSTQSLKLAPGGECKVGARSARGLVLAAGSTSAVVECAVETAGDLSISRVKVGKKAASLYVGPLARRAASTLEIGRY